MSSYGFNITVDVSNLKINDQLSPQIATAIRGAIQSSLAIVRDRWQQEVQQKLKSSRMLYLQGLGFDSIMYPIDSDGFAGAVQLKGKFPNMLEKGFPAFDIKAEFSKSSKVHKSKSGGWYLTVPFRHSVPNSNGMFGDSMPKGVYKAARKLTSGGRLSFPGAGDKSWTGYQRKNTKYDGLTRIVKSYQNTNQSQYYTFRRVSNNSDSMSWWHPGYGGVKVADKLLPFARSTFMDMLATNLNGIA